MSSFVFNDADMKEINDMLKCLLTKDDEKQLLKITIADSSVKYLPRFEGPLPFELETGRHDADPAVDPVRLAHCTSVFGPGLEPNPNMICDLILTINTKHNLIDFDCQITIPEEIIGHIEMLKSEDGGMT
ncbi:hypothetical protein RND71_034439 [Anisodus tanguticus]|uniref:Uncharacterized protein n=1 Tax=Anisodus tanguticus TaxID=243964 RepID=A0AAE1V508_9SOLA|nr:hypothetical protein RND71_034439 [Anisodus tanguticus]